MAAALQQQVDNDFGPVWGVAADISAPGTSALLPSGTWPIKIVDDIGGAGGVHLDEDGQPYAEAVIGRQLSIAIATSRPRCWLIREATASRRALTSTRPPKATGSLPGRGRRPLRGIQL
jgi:hypothetical protein